MLLTHLRKKELALSLVAF